MKFHINPELGPRKCTATKRPCKYAGDEHFDSKDSALKEFNERLTKNYGNISKISKKDTPNFDNSKVVDEEGNLITVYHGSETDFDTFDPSFTGKGDDAYGSGFYFNTNEDTAKTYGKTKSVQLNITNPIVVDGYENMSLNHIEIPLSTVRKMMKHIPNIYNQPDSEDMNPIGDYIPEYWDKEYWSKEELDKMMDTMAKENYADSDFTTIENLFDREGATNFREALMESSDWDGVQVKFKDGSSHWIAWTPEQIKEVD